MLCKFLPYNNVNQPQVYICSLPLEPPSQPPPIPPLWVITEYQVELPVTQQLSTRSSTLHTVMYMFQCYSLNLSHPLFAWLCPQVCSLCILFLSCPTNSFISTIFLDSLWKYFNDLELSFSRSLHAQFYFTDLTFFIS